MVSRLGTLSNVRILSLAPLIARFQQVCGVLVDRVDTATRIINRIVVPAREDILFATCNENDRDAGFHASDSAIELTNPRELA